MFKIQLPQPLASLVCAGVIQMIPNIWGDEVRVGDLIFVYATDFTDEFREEWDYTNLRIRKVHNESFLGNLPGNLSIDSLDNCINKFVGFVKAKLSGKIDNIFFEQGQEYIFVGEHRLLSPKSVFTDFETNEKGLFAIASKTKEFKTKYIQYDKKTSTLVVPVNNRVFMSFRNLSEYRDKFLFREDYMNNLPLKRRKSNLYKGYSNKRDKNEILYVSFVNNGMSIKFGTRCECGYIYKKFGEDSESIPILYFDLGHICTLSGKYIPLDSLAETDTAETIGALNKTQTNDTKTQTNDIKSISSDIEIDDKPLVFPKIDDSDFNEKKSDEYRPPRPRIIYTPMGGSNKWKR